MGDLHLEPSIVDLTFARPGSLSLSPRSVDQSPQWASDTVRVIEVSLSVSPKPIVLRVRRFMPEPGDALARTWLASDGTPRSTPLAPYTLADPAETSRSLQEHIRDNCVCFPRAVAGSHPVVRKVYHAVENHLASLRVSAAVSAPGSSNAELALVEVFCELWYGIRNTMGSSWISGTETLGMQPVDEEGYPLRGKVSVPRQVVQNVSCLFDQILKPLQTRFLLALKDALECDPIVGRNLFFSTFIIVFVLLHECEDISKDRERYARQNFMESYFSLPHYVESLHKSARVLVERWFDFTESLGVEWSNPAELRTSLSFLPHAQREFVVECFDIVMLQTNPVVRASPQTWTRDLCFVSHMFGAYWEPNATYFAK